MLERYTLTSAQRFGIVHGEMAPIEAKGGARDARWGQLAPWQGHGGKRRPPIHEIDAASVKSTAKRCLVLADGFYATRKIGTKKQPFWIHGEQRFFAGVLATHKDDGVESFAIVMVPANAVVAPMVERMPAMVDARWLEGGELVVLPLDGWRVDAEGKHNPNQGQLF